ncbi:hypothetical protein Bca52824_033265 [Brassica carinata]|uniref:CSN8/PSMD8/EIF3K domain-containing protein n=1 Tax=Brassica carinata TaxID=52824 RepID=A0A8X7SIG8_BRACI|nr:hypothetical protein Bca52824_033265 [Brassica carinata]
MTFVRFLSKTIPTNLRESKHEVFAAWRIGRKLCTRDYAGVYEAICCYDWSPEAKDMLAAFLAPLLHLQDIICSMPGL